MLPQQKWTSLPYTVEKKREEPTHIKSCEEEGILTILPFTIVHNTVGTFTSLVEMVPNQEADAVMSGRLLVQSQACSSGQEVGSNTVHPGSQAHLL